MIQHEGNDPRQRDRDAKQWLHTRILMLIIAVLAVVIAGVVGRRHGLL